MKSNLRFRVVGLLLLISSLLPFCSFAQNCTPDTTLADAPLGFYPTPFDSLVFPNGGLGDFPATIDLPYELTFTVKLTDSVTIAPFNVDLNSFALDNMDGLIGLPIGLEYACDPPNCIFPDSTLGCLIISGTPISANRPGDYNLQFMGQLFTKGGDSITFNFPSPALPGEYLLSLNRSDSLDIDEDGIFDNEDNCVTTNNPNQIDEDGDGAGAACDCDDTVATGASCTLGCQPFYLDNDGDGFGHPLDSVLACQAPIGYVTNNLDCDDENAAINPNATELFSNGIDDNCDGLIDEMLAGPDADSDGIIDSLDNCPMLSNTEQIDFDEDGFGAVCDCNDSLATVNSTAIEIPDNDLDDNCNGRIDEDIDAIMDTDEDGIIDSLDNCLGIPNPNQIDEDGDGVGAACDCDDSELIGFNCSDGCSTFFADNDGDGFGNPNIIRIACTSPAGFVQSGEDCDDTNPNINPLAQEIPDNGIDDNCNGITDESNDPILWYLDADGDGFGDPAIDSTAIAKPRQFVNNDLDCDDTNQLIYENALEIIDNLDNDCNGLVDDFEGNCDDFTDPGLVGNDQIICAENPVPAILENLTAPNGGSGTIEIMWMMTTEDPTDGNAQWQLIPGTHALAYSPPALGETTYFRRCARRKGCSKFLQESNIVTITFSNSCEEVVEIIEGEGEMEEEEMEMEIDPCLNVTLTVSAEIIDPDCNSSNGSIALTVGGGTAPYSYAWEPNLGATNQLDSLREGIYSVTILDSLNCFLNYSEILSEPDSCNSPPGLAPGGFEFGRVQANVLDNSVVWLEWQGINEQKNSQYQLEHSKEGNHFKVLPKGKKGIGSVNAYYQENDDAPTFGTSFYRIKYIAENGYYLHSPIVQVYVTAEGATLVIAYPNPFEEQLTVDFLSPLEAPITVIILNNLGKTIFSAQIPKGILRHDLTLPEAATGLFTLQVISKSGRQVKKIMKFE